MSSRDKILNSIKSNQPELVPLPEVVWPATAFNTDNFITTLNGIGGNVEFAEDGEWIQEAIDKTNSYQSLASIDTATIRGLIGVAENGAIWVDMNSLAHRAIPFICQHLVIVLYERDIVATMHHAYSKIDVASQDFGVFIAGPSKTADIEQSLVIGAHGARSLTVRLIR